MADDAFSDWSLSEEDEAFLMTNLHPTETGLPMAVDVSQREGARHDIRIEVSGIQGGRMRLRDAAIVVVRPEPRVLHGQVAPDDLRRVIAWIKLNEAVLIDFWEERARTSDLMARLQRLSG